MLTRGLDLIFQLGNAMKLTEMMLHEEKNTVPYAKCPITSLCFYLAVGFHQHVFYDSREQNINILIDFHHPSSLAKYALLTKL